MRVRSRLVLAAALLSAFTLGTPVPGQNRMELHLVLAFDVSASVNDVEFDLQRSGTADALRSDLVAAAIDRAPGGVAIAIVQWSSRTRQALGMDWVELHDMRDVATYADRVDAMPRRLPGGGTMIHSGLEFAARMLEAAPGYAHRQVIDIAGNGRTDDEKRLRETRAKLLSEGIVINGLAIEEDAASLTRYFEAYVIGGQNAFVITADDFDDFADAMEAKLLREISGAVFSMWHDKSIAPVR
ncbi:DUF1194 domain-containing protein [uncultured Roseovarius sp.]|uniref:DUF1194 domain-containing protein n=1 Tax=uncultured Roseovarius sp. TaxID=293344 RepID=UPI002634ABEC|nr:DUF1194 domain-containing protein [uncultured Roseovarius sp.]